MLASLLPAGHLLIAQQNAKSAHQAEISAIAAKAEQDIAVSLERAKTCAFIASETPIGAGSTITWDVGRAVPPSTPLCDVHRGYTAEVAADGTVSDLRRIPAEQLKEAIASRPKSTTTTP